MVIKKSKPTTDNRNVTPVEKESDKVFENKLRPTNLQEYIGQN